MRDISSAVEELRAETVAVFDWLIDGVERHSPVTFVPNPGNIGDALINLACWQYLEEKFDDVRICSIRDRPQTEHVFVGGGGNLVEPLYDDVSSLLEHLARDQRVFIFSSTIYGYSALLRLIKPQARIVCRDETSLRFVIGHVDASNVRLGHDAAFALAPRLRAEFAAKAAVTSTVEAKLFRTDSEGARSDQGGLDIMGQYNSDWVDMALADRVVRLAINYILGFGRIYTDRLHCSILSGVLGRDTILYPNSYFKNSAVFERSLSRLPNVTFDGRHAFQATPATDPVAFLQMQETG